METSTAGRFIWHDLDSNDAENAIAFYGKALGWSAEPFEGGPMPYWIWMGEGGRSGGVCQLTDQAREHGAVPGWTGYVESGDVDRDTERAVALGAQVLMAPMTLPTVGRMSVIRDPQGASLALFAPDPSMGDSEASAAGDRSAIGSFLWADLAAPKAQAAFGFYAELFRWEESRRIPMGEGEPYRVFAVDGVELGGVAPCPAGQDVPPSWLYYVRVAHLDEVLERVRAGEGEVMSGASDVPGGRVAQCRDPQGSAFGLFQETR